MGYKTPQARRQATAKIVAIYALFGFTWIYGSDTLLGWLVHDPEIMVKIAVIKGSLFILCTATLLYFLINRFAKQLAAAESARIESLKNYQAIFNATNEAIFVHDAQTGHILDINDRMLEIFGYGRKEVLSLDIGYMSEGTPPYSQQDAVEKMRKAMLEGPQVFEWLCRKKNGELFWTEVSLRKVAAQDNDKIIAVVRDISERKRTEDEMAVAYERFKAVMDSLDALVYVTDMKTYELLFINEYGKKLFGDIEGQICWQTLQCEQTGPCDFCTNDRLLLEDGQPAEACVWEFQNTVNGHWYQCRDKAIRWHDNRLVRMEIATDITELRRIEADKLSLETQLQQAQKMESIGRLAGGVAHDFNNMLTVILGQAELALLKIDPANPLTANFKEIQKTAERSADLTQQLLAFARKQTVSPKVLNLNETIATTLKMLQRLIGEDIQLVWQPAMDLWPLKIDSSQIDQILANLCVNARDAIADTGIITIETANCTIDANYCTAHLDAIPGDYVRLNVSDNGCGMHKETLSHVFEPFYTTKELGKGTGLGLATVYGIVKQNNGFIDIHSEPGQGTTFAIYLPRLEGKSCKVQTEGTAEPITRGHETILLVEDEAAILEIVTIMLGEQGYTVITANTPGEAIQMAREHAGEIHLLMTDVIMPEMNGRDLAKNLLSIYPDMKRLFMSGYTADVIAHHGVLDEGVHFIQKPFSLQNLVTKVRDALDH